MVCGPPFAQSNLTDSDPLFEGRRAVDFSQDNSHFAAYHERLSQAKQGEIAMGANDIVPADLDAPEPMLSDEGVRFAVTIEQNLHPCVITHDALRQLSREVGFSLDAMNTYRAFEAKINSVARSRVLRGARQLPLVLGAGSFH